MSLTYKLSNPRSADPVLVPKSHYGPVTALKFLDDRIIFKANGPSLQVFVDQKLAKTVRVFERQKIHGIDISEDKKQVILFGGRSFTVVPVTDIVDLESPQIKEYGINDWIMSMTFDWGLLNIYLLTSRNIVLTISLENYKVTSTKVFLENSILYSGAIRVLQDRVIIAAGTILGGVFVWDLASCKLIHNLVGHEGAIFGVAIHPTGNLLCSCSDDRSVRVWDLDTGSNWCTGWGHSSRIWLLTWFNGNRIMSYGEDATARMWEFERNVDKVLYCLDVWELHQGKHIFSGDVNESLQIAATGGADGRLRLVDLNRGSRTNNWRKQFAISTVSDKKDDFFKNYEQFNSGLIALTASGACYKFKHFAEWELLFEDRELSNFQILNVFKDENLLLITSKAGSTTALKFDQEFNLVQKVVIPKPEQLKGNVTNALTVKKTEESFFLLLESPNPKDDFIIHELDFDLNTKSTIVLPRPDTRLSPTSLSYDITNDWLFIGSRYITFFIVDLKDISRTNYWKKFVKGDTITSSSVINSTPGEIVVLVTVRDGDYFIMKIDLHLELEVLQHNKVQRGFLEGGYLDENNELILLNFKSDTFHLWNETRQFEIFKEQCGGIHRTWNLSINDLKRHNYNFVYNKSSNLIIVNTGNQFFPESCLDNGIHGREIRDISASTESRPNGAKLVLTGAEDTVVKLSEVKQDGEIRTFASLRHHVSGLQKVKFILGSQYLASTAAREEFFIWKINDSYEKLGPLINRFTKLTPSSSEPDLRIMDFDTLCIYKDDKLYGWLILNVYSDSSIKIFEFNIYTKQFKAVLEDRYSTCCLWDARFIVKSDRVYAMIGATDGHVAIYDLSTELEKLYEFSGDNDTLILKEQPELEIDPEIVLEIGTKFETVPLFPELVIKQQIHQSGIKSHVLISHPYDDSIVDLITAGDDNALVHTRLVFKKGTIDLEIKTFKENAASCTITSLSLVPVGQESKRYVFAASVDQMARVWEIDYKGPEQLKCIDSRYTTIGDTGSSEVCEVEGKKMAFIGGAGLSCWEMEGLQ